MIKDMEVEITKTLIFYIGWLFAVIGQKIQDFGMIIMVKGMKQELK